ncbi:hypothetical protein Dsin_030424 [Dipteronia sinensis]|uniref:Uncharacterized protein n=1 Tax=Dipteronia sinensis TaxID=43782 RepID=A0AAE0DR40_9ROSI|nr:hypothetical protein Dsin_030424 [Dipteronia sinensis]
MMRMGFPLRWIDLVIDCISTLSLGVVIKGKFLASVLFCKANAASCEEISRVLKVYKRGSRQMVNLQKSNITFSQNMGSALEPRFRLRLDLSVFNQALPAKQGWRLAIGSESLALKLLKAKYFKHEDFLCAKLNPGGVSCGERELLQKGIKWKVGDGSRIKAFSDPWISRPSSFKHITACADNETKVFDFLLEDLSG